MVCFVGPVDPTPMPDKLCLVAFGLVVLVSGQGSDNVKWTVGISLTICAFCPSSLRSRTGREAMQRGGEMAADQGALILPVRLWGS